MQQINKKGLITALSCYFIWGLLPIYWGLLHHISAYSVLAHRIIWSALFMSFVAIGLNYQQFKKDCIHLKQNISQLGLLILASIFISSNWGYTFGPSPTIVLWILVLDIILIRSLM